MHQRHTRKHRVDFEVDPAESSVVLLRIRGYPFFGLTSCSCGERAGRPGPSLLMQRGGKSSGVSWQDSLWHFYPEGYRAIRCTHTNTLVDYLSFVAGPAGSIRNGNWLSTGRAGMSSADDMTSPSGYPYRAILVVIIVSNIVNINPGGDCPGDFYPNSYANRMVRDSIRAAASDVFAVFRGVPFVSARRCLLYITSDVYTVSHTEIPRVKRVAIISRSIAWTRCN